MWQKRNYSLPYRVWLGCSHPLVFMQGSSMPVIISKIWCLQQLPSNHKLCMQALRLILAPPHVGGNVMVTCAGNCVLIRFSFSQLFKLGINASWQFLFFPLFFSLPFSFNSFEFDGWMYHSLISLSIVCYDFFSTLRKKYNPQDSDGF